MGSTCFGREASYCNRAEFRALLRHRRDEANASGRTREHSEAAVDSRWRVQSESDFPLPVGIGHPTEVEESIVLVCFYASLAVCSLFSACASHTRFSLVVTTPTASESSLSQI